MEQTLEFNIKINIKHKGISQEIINEIIQEYKDYLLESLVDSDCYIYNAFDLVSVNVEPT
jgi:hypothetical protein